MIISQATLGPGAKIMGPFESRGLWHRKKRPRVDFFVKASFGGLTNLHNQEHPIYSNITSSTLPATSLPCLVQTPHKLCTSNFVVFAQVIYVVHM